MIDIGEALQLVLAHAQPGETSEVALSEALYRALAAPVTCDTDDPPFDRAVMDGYAVRAADVAQAPVTLRVAGQIAAGAIRTQRLLPGEAVQINTGAPIPPGADAVVRVEDTEPVGADGQVLIRVAVRRGTFITPRAANVKAGQQILGQGTRLTPLEIGAAAAAGAGTVQVYRSPTVAVLATGDELVDIDQRPTGAQIRNSSRYMLDALIQTARATPVSLGVARDDRSVLRDRIVEGLRSDVLCLTGGVSMGAFDFVPEVLESCGATLHVRKLSIKPGRPTVFGTMPDGTLIFGLPGNPVSTFVAFELLVRPALAAMQGLREAVRQPLRLRLNGALAATSDRRAFWPARVVGNPDGGLEAEALSWKGSGDSFGMVTANALIVRPPGAPAVGTGDTVSIMLLDGHDV